MSLNGFYANNCFPYKARVHVKLKHDDFKREIEKGISLCFRVTFISLNKPEEQYRDTWTRVFSIQQSKYKEHDEKVYLHYENWVFEQILKVVIANPAANISIELQKY